MTDPNGTADAATGATAPPSEQLENAVENSARKARYRQRLNELYAYTKTDGRRQEKLVGREMELVRVLRAIEALTAELGTEPSYLQLGRRLRIEGKASAIRAKAQRLWSVVDNLQQPEGPWTAEI